MLDWALRQLVAPLALRSGLAWIFIYHGLGKVLRTGNDWGLSWAKDQPGLPSALQGLVAWGELLGGIAVGLGFLTRVFSPCLGAFQLLTLQPGFDRYEFNLALFCMCLALAALGPGPISLDRLLFPADARKKR